VALLDWQLSWVWRKANVHRRLITLQILGYVTQDRSTARYRVSLKLRELGPSSLRHFDLPRVARQHLEHLAALTRETVHLSLLDRLEVIYLDKIDSTESVGAYSRLGRRAPAYCVATGKVSLAHAGEDVMSQIPGTRACYTDNTLTDAAVLRDALTRIHARGYAVNARE
jgi:IclR family KDG regulon transcriptional repressor